MENDTRYPVRLDPLSKSHRDDQLEDDIYKVFQSIFEKYIRPYERDLNVHAVPHLGSFDLVSRSVEKDGLSLINNDEESVMRYLYKAWKARNPKRGLSFVKLYLRLLFGGNADIYQMWQRKGLPYPEYLIESDDGDSFLTSRVRVVFEDLISRTGIADDINRIAPALRVSIAARFVLEVYARVSTASTHTVTTGVIEIRNFDSDESQIMQANEEVTATKRISSSVLAIHAEKLTIQPEQ